MFSSIYGFIGSTLFWYKLFSATLEGLGFEINPYDIFVANRIVEGTQCTLEWYVDDNKLSHKNPSVILDIIKKLKKTIVYLSVVRGDKHTLLRVNIEIKDKIVQFDMVEQLGECITMFG